MTLSKAESKVALLASVGLTAEEVADKLCISPKTVTTHISNIFRKLGVNKTLEIAKYVECRRKGEEFNLERIRLDALAELDSVRFRKKLRKYGRLCFGR